MNKFRTGSELAMNKFLFKLVKQIELLNLFNRGSDRLSSGLDLTDFGWVAGGGWVFYVGLRLYSAKLGQYKTTVTNICT